MQIILFINESERILLSCLVMSPFISLSTVLTTINLPVLIRCSRLFSAQQFILLIYCVLLSLNLATCIHLISCLDPPPSAHTSATPRPFSCAAPSRPVLPSSRAPSCWYSGRLRGKSVKGRELQVPHASNIFYEPLISQSTDTYYY